MDKERLNQIENELDKINNMYVDTSYIQMLNGFKELDKNELVATIKDIWRFAAINYECPIEEYRTFMNENIRSRFVHLRCMYTKYREQLLSEMVAYLNKTLVKGIYDDTTKMVQIEPAYNIQRNQFNTNEAYNNWNLLKNVDIYESSKKEHDFMKKVYVDIFKKQFLDHAESFRRKFGLKYSDVENWSYERWVAFGFECKEAGFTKLDVLRRTKDYVERPVGRPKGQYIIKMIDVETEEVIERFDCRQSVIDTISIKKSRLSKCLSAYKANPNAKSTWIKYKYEGKRYWFVEEN